MTNHLGIFTDLHWGLGALHRELAAALRTRGWVVDLIDWADVDSKTPAADVFMTLPSTVWALVQRGIPRNRIILVAHLEEDLKRFDGDLDDYAGYAVVSDGMVASSIAMGFRRVPFVVRQGIDVDHYRCPPPTSLRRLGYATVVSRQAMGHEIKRGYLAERIAKDLGLQLVVTDALSTYEDLPKFFAGVDAVICTSLLEGAGRPALEAAACGRPCIATPTGHHPRLATEGCCRIGPIDENDFVTEASRWLLEMMDPSVLRGRSSVVRICAEAYRRWDVVLPDWERLLDVALLAS